MAGSAGKNDSMESSARVMSERLATVRTLARRSPSTAASRTRLARFWAAALGYEVVDLDANIDGVIAAGSPSPTVAYLAR